jgi:hypothetical protein
MSRCTAGAFVVRKALMASRRSEDEFDEPTGIELRQSRTPVPKAAVAVSVPPTQPLAAQMPVTRSASDVSYDEDATEFYRERRRPTSMSQPQAKGRAVALASQSVSSSEAPPVAPARPAATASTESMSQRRAPMARTEPAMTVDADQTIDPSVARPRPVPEASSSHRRTPASAPRVTRIVLLSETDAPRQPVRPLIPEGDNDGLLVIEAPADAQVFVNGIERGRGVVRVTDLDCEGRHAVRVVAPGHVPWSGSVSLEGKKAAKVRPTLKKKER